jgi:hypothetical protein
MIDTPYYMYLMFACPVLLVSGLIITAINKKNRKLGLALVIGSVIVFIIGFGTCLNSFKLGNMN